MPRRVVLLGDPEGEHLSLELEGDEIVAISHEYRVGLGPQLSLWFDRPYFSVKTVVLIRKLKELLGEEL
jgi:hypothetical protein